MSHKNETKYICQKEKWSIQSNWREEGREAKILERAWKMYKLEKKLIIYQEKLQKKRNYILCEKLRVEERGKIRKKIWEMKEK